MGNKDDFERSLFLTLGLVALRICYTVPKIQAHYFSGLLTVLNFFCLFLLLFLFPICENEGVGPCSQ